MAQALTISQLEEKSGYNLYYSGVVDIEFAEFQKGVLSHDGEINKNLFEGKVYVVRNARLKENLGKLKNTVYQLGQDTPAMFHKIEDDCPNFHVVNEENPLYKLLMRVHTYHFFNWNEGPTDIFEMVSEELEVYETLCEQDPSKILRNTCADDMVARLQVHHYPRGGGHTQMHTDPTKLVKVAWVMMMTKLGVEYQSGGLYFMDLFGNKFYPENSLDIEVGDSIVFYPAMLHGVDPVDTGGEPEWESDSGRWNLIFNNLPVAK